MGVSEKVDPVVRHQVEISAAMVVPQIAALAPSQADTAIRM
jgi:hypothetical protein